MFPAPRLGSESIGTKPFLVDFGGKNEEESVGNEVHLNTCRGKRAAGGRRFCSNGLEILEEVYRMVFGVGMAGIGDCARWRFRV